MFCFLTRSSFKVSRTIFPFSVVNCFFTGLYFLFILVLPLVGRVQSESFQFCNWHLIVLGAISLNSLVNIVNFLVFKLKILQNVINFLLTYIYVSISFYHLKTKSALEFSVLKENVDILFYFESLKLVFDCYTKKNLYYVIPFFILLLVINLLTGFFTKWNPPKNLIRGAIANITVYVLIIFSPFFVYDEISYFLQTMTNQKDISDYFDNDYSQKFGKSKYPFWKKMNVEKMDTEKNAIKNRKNVILILVESLNAGYIGKRTSDGREFTPFLNSLIEKSVFVKNFYGNSVQTCKGHFATLCSLVPLIKGKAFEMKNTKFKCLPEILAQNGYDTFFIQAYQKIDFDNTRDFQKRNGFKYVTTITDRLSDDDRKHIWGWGVQDDIFYQRALELILEKRTDRPFFATLATISLHNNFKYVPLGQRKMFPQQSESKHYYGNNINVVDGYLRTFFDEVEKNPQLRNSIIIITGDHGFPAGAHGNYYSEIAFYDDNFRTPLFIINSGMKNQIIDDVFHSQLDIAPTILDLLGIADSNAFLGSSIFSDDMNMNYIPLIQPYDGTAIGIVKRPYKYMFHMRTGSEFLYDVVKDPMERNNLSGRDEMKDKMRELKFISGMIYLNQQLIMENRIMF